MASAGNQKLLKLSIASSEYSSSRDNSIDYGRLSNPSSISIQDEMNNLISILKQTLKTQGIIYEAPSSPLDSLKSLTSILCTEFLKATQNIKTLCLNEDTSQGLQEVNVNIFKASKTDLLSKIFEIPEIGIMLDKEDCEHLSALLIGAIRDSASHDLQEKIQALQEKIVVCVRKNQDFKIKLKQKEKKIHELKTQIEKLKSMNSLNIPSKKSCYE